MIQGINHIGIVVADMEAAVKSYEQLGLNVTHRETVRRGIDVKIAFVPVGDVALELIQPIKGSNSRFTKFLAEKGEGIHHLALQVENIEDAASILKSRGISFPVDSPMKGTRGTRALWLENEAVRGCFVHLSDYPEGDAAACL